MEYAMPMSFYRPRPSGGPLAGLDQSSSISGAESLPGARGLHSSQYHSNLAGLIRINSIWRTFWEHRRSIKSLRQVGSCFT